MSRFFSNKYLKYRGVQQGTEIDHDRSCDGCGYNLRGLKVGGQCPECGAAIRLEELSKDTLDEVPLPELRRLRAGFLLAMVCIPMLLVAPIGVAIAFTAKATSFGLFAMTILWVVAVFLMTPEIPTPGGKRRGFSSESRLRHWARILQVGWPLFVALAIMIPGLPGVAAPLKYTGWILGGLCGMAAIGGTVLLAFLLLRLAEWCYNDVAEKYLNWSVWGLMVCPVLTALAWITVFKVFTCTFIVWWVLSFLSFFFAVFSLGKSVTWSAVHAKERLHRDRALRESVSRADPGAAT
jgi:hypothetical protein